MLLLRLMLLRRPCCRHNYHRPQSAENLRPETIGKAEEDKHRGQAGLSGYTDAQQLFQMPAQMVLLLHARWLEHEESGLRPTFSTMSRPFGR